MNKKESQRKYYQSEKGKAAQKRYKQSEKGKEAQKRYKQSEKGKEANKKYANSEKGKIASKRYANSEKGTTARMNAQRRYRAKKRQMLLFEERPTENPYEYDNYRDWMLEEEYRNSEK